MKKLFKDERIRTLLGLAALFYFQPNMKAIYTTAKRMYRKKREPFIEVHWLFEKVS